ADPDRGRFAAVYPAALPACGEVMPCHQSSSTSARVFARGNAFRVPATASRRRAHSSTLDKGKATRTDPGVYACPPADGEAGSVPPEQRAAFGHAKVTIIGLPRPPPAGLPEWDWPGGLA